MYMLIGYPVGVIVEGVVLAEGRKRLRVAAAGFPDVLELKRFRDGWRTESGQSVEIEFLMSTAKHGVLESPARPALVARANGAPIPN